MCHCRRLLRWACRHWCITIFLISVIIACGIWYYTNKRYLNRFNEGRYLNRITKALVVYAKENSGSLPTCLDDLYGTGLASPGKDDIVHIWLDRIGDSDHHEAWIIPLEVLARFSLSFGARPSELVIVDGAYAPTGGARLLIAPSGQTYLKREKFEEASLRLAQAMKAAANKAQTQPAAETLGSAP